MAGNSFELIAQALLEQQRIMEQLEQENYELRRQLADLREGRGVLIDIGGKRFALMGNQLVAPPLATPLTPAPEIPEPPVFVTPPPQSITPVPETTPAERQVASVQEEVAAADEMSESPTTAIPESPRPITRKLDEEEVAQPVPATSLEEMMLDEFAAQATSPLAVWGGPINPVKKSETIEEDEKAVLRRELIGSFLLE